LTTIPWQRFERAACDPALVTLAKTAALVEANSADYVRYLHGVFSDDAPFRAAASHWGEEEAQHGAALARWAELADPGFDFAACLARFRDTYRIPHGAVRSVRGSPAGELLARCVVEAGTCSYYSALRDAAREPVLRVICHHIAQDELRHYRLFASHFARYHARHRLSGWARFRIALGRVAESADDELARAFYSANRDEYAEREYERARCAARYRHLALSCYRDGHVRTLTAMIARALGWRAGSRAVRALQWSACRLWPVAHARAGRAA